jgi:hypothetical protein
MAYRANLFDFGAVAGSAGGANAATNDAAFAAAIASATKIIECEPGIYEVSQPVCLNGNAKAIRGTDGCDVFNTVSDGSVLEWWGGAQPVVKIGPSGTSDLIAPEFSGFQIRCQSVATLGVASFANRRMKLNRVQVVSPVTVGFHFQEAPAGHTDVGSNYDAEISHCTANVYNGATGMVFDNLSGAVITCPHVTHQNGSAYFLRGIDTCAFFNVNSSRHEGGTGHSVFFEGTTGKYCVGNRFFGLHCGAWPIGSTTSIWSRGDKARQNRIYGLDGVDTPPVVTIEPASELYYEYQGGGYTPTLAAEKALDRVPKEVIRTY